VNSGKTQRPDAAMLCLAKIAAQAQRTVLQRMRHSPGKREMDSRGAWAVKAMTGLPYELQLTNKTR
jgi:hypothetical protein